MNEINEYREIEIEGLGIVFHSGGILKMRQDGYDFLENEFWNPEHVSRHVNAGDITAFCTGSPGIYHLKFNTECPGREEMNEYVAKVQIGILIDDGILYIRDLYDLMEWDSKCEDAEKIFLDNGIYLLTAYENRISDREFYESGQDIYIHIEKVEKMLDLNYEEVPMLVY